MPSPRAYNEAQVIATGIELEKTGPVTAKMLHEALGGRGDRYTAFGTWQAFMDQRRHLSGIPSRSEPVGFSPAVNEFLTQFLKLAAAMASQVQTETAEPLERRAGYLVHGLDELLTERAALEAENRHLRDALACAACETRAEDPVVPRASLLILPADGPRRPPRERLSAWPHQPAEKPG
jgi:hypothetical protein